MKVARLREWREAKGLSQRELAALSGVSEASIARIESGASPWPSTVRKLADTLGVSVADLIERPPVPLGERAAVAGKAEAPRETGRPHELERVRELLDSVYKRDIVPEEAEALVADLFRIFKEDAQKRHARGREGALNDHDG